MDKQQNAPNPVVVLQEFIDAGVRLVERVVLAIKSLANQIAAFFKPILDVLCKPACQPTKSRQSRAFLKIIRSRSHQLKIAVRPHRPSGKRAAVYQKKQRSYRETILAEPGLVAFFDGDVFVTNRSLSPGLQQRVSHGKSGR